MSKSIKKFILYYTAVSAVAIGTINTIYPDGIKIKLFLIVLFLLSIGVIIYIWAERQEHPESEAKPEGASLLLELSEALDRVYFADHNDEGTAELANKIVRSELDKRAMKYNKYRLFRNKNPLVFAAVLSVERDLIGFFDIFPLTEEAANNIISGKIKENQISVSDILPIKEKCNNIYIASVVINKDQKKFSDNLSREIIMIKLYEYIYNNYNCIYDIRFLAFGYTIEGINALKRSGFNIRLSDKHGPQKRPLFVMEPGKAVEIHQRYIRIFNALKQLSRRQGP